MLVEKIGKAAMLEQLAEECAELTQAALKYARFIRRDNPTNKSFGDIYKNYCEEIADVRICLKELSSTFDEDDIASWTDLKHERIRDRIDRINNEGKEIL